MNVIAPAVLVDIESMEYRAHGKVIRVFDTNGCGELLPVEYKQNDNSSKFVLKNLPHGKIYAEVVR